MANKFAQEEYYHLYNRGVDKRTVFTSPKDYERFLFNLYLCNSTESFKIDNITKYKGGSSKIFSTLIEQKLVSIHAYSLMPNHFHLLVSERKEGGISLFMQKLGTAYTMYFNKKYERSGSLFQGKFKSVHVDSDEQFRHLFSYIHANPFSVMRTDGSIHLSDIEKVLNYPYSSMKEYLLSEKTSRPASVIVDVIEFIQGELKDKKMAKKHLDSWLDFHSHIK